MKFDAKKLVQFNELIRAVSPHLNKKSLNVLEWVLAELGYRQPLLVTEHVGDYCLCPRCDASLERDYMAYCTVCGQRLKWGSMKKLKYVDWNERYP